VRLLNWNVQWCRGIDGRVDAARIAAEIRRLADADVICLQELAANLPQLEGNDAADQAHALAHLFPEHTACFVSGVDVPSANGRRGYFGNLLLSRLPVGRVLRHSLPWPPRPHVQSMPRVAVEAVVQASFGAVRVTTTHLEAYSQTQRAAQVARLREIHAEAGGTQFQHDEPGIFQTWPRPASGIVCGDFNLAPDNPLHAQMKQDFVDAWEAAHPGVPHPPTFHVHEDEPAFCCDYVFVTPDLAPRIRSVRIDAATQASDHQPLIVALG
jgi:endonuclease/exonuclease/phosphatase family metal-dependent hydrolase